MDQRSGGVKERKIEDLNFGQLGKYIDTLVASSFPEATYLQYFDR